LGAISAGAAVSPLLGAAAALVAFFAGFLGVSGLAIFLSGLLMF
jgi:hypothetical protein